MPPAAWLRFATLVNGASVGRWRGYAYDSTGRLSDLLEAESVAPPSVSGLPVLDRRVVAGQHVGRPLEVRARCGHWQHERDLRADDGQVEHNTATCARVSVAATVRQRRAVDRRRFDVYGRVSKLDTRIFDYDLLGRLSVVRAADGAVIEQYLYGAGGELRAVVGSERTDMPGPHRPAVAFDGTGKPAWDATWLPGGTHLLLWRDLGPPVARSIPSAISVTMSLARGTWTQRILPARRGSTPKVA